MRFSDKDLRILAFAQFLADRSVTQIAKEAGVSDSAARYALKKFHDSGVLRAYPVIDFFRLGYRKQALFFNLRAAEGYSSKEIVDWLEQNQRVSWVYENFGMHDIGFGFLSNHGCRLDNILYGLADKFGMIFREKHLCTVRRVSVFGRRYLTELPETKSIHIEEDAAPAIELSEHEHEILKELSLGPGTGLRETARRLGTPFSTFEYRLQALREKEIFQGFLYSIRPSSLGALLFRVFIRTRGVNRELEQSLRMFCERSKSVVSLMEFSGNLDYVLRVETWSRDEALAFKRELESSFPNWFLQVEMLAASEEAKLLFYPFQDFENL